MPNEASMPISRESGKTFLKSCVSLLAAPLNTRTTPHVEMHKQRCTRKQISNDFGYSSPSHTLAR
jgi:hypothetical protein